MKVGIIGGGISGLTAGYILAKKGNAVTIFEGSDILGGLASGFKIHGSNLERSYHHIFKTDTEIQDLVKELKIEDELKWHPSSLAVYYDGKLYPFSSPFDLLKFRPLSLVNRIRTGIVAFYLQKTTKWQRMEKVTAENEKPAGTARIRYRDNKMKLERLAILDKYRGKGFGVKFMQFLINYGEEKKVDEIYMHAQYYLLEFYKKLGFEQRGEIFYDAEIEHIEMFKTSS